MRYHCGRRWAVGLALLAGCSTSGTPDAQPDTPSPADAPQPDARAQTALRTLDLVTNSLVVDPTRHVVYASVPSRAGAAGNSVATIDPIAGTVTGSIFVGSEPGALALSDDGDFLYVAIDGASSFRRIDLTTGEVGAPIELGNGDFGPLIAGDLRVVPGAPHTVVVSLWQPQVSPSFFGIVVYDDAALRAPRWAESSGGRAIVVADAETVYAYDDETSSNNLAQLRLDAGGLHTIKSVSGIVSGFSTTYLADRGSLITSTGRVIDGTTLTAIGQFDHPIGEAVVTVDPSGSPVTFLVTGTSTTLDRYARATFLPLGALPVSVPFTDGTDVPKNLVQAAPGAFAFRKRAQVFFLQVVAAP